MSELYKMVVDGGDAPDRKKIGAKLKEIATVTTYIAESLDAARRSGIFLDDVVIGKIRADWEPGPGYIENREATLAPLARFAN